MNEDNLQRGRQILDEMTGGRGEAVEARWRELHPDLADLIVGFVAGEIWARPGLDRKTRSLVTVAATAALGRTSALALNVRMALRNGATREEIVEVLLHLTAYAGFPAGWEGLETAAAVFAEADGTAG
jgi:4-carboxymuconolactone decarboxylase